MRQFAALTALLAASSAFAQPVPGEDLSHAPGAFRDGDALYVPVDFLEERLELTLDVTRGVATGHATVRFYAGQDGRPLLDLVPEARSVSLNGTRLPGLLTPQDPARVTALRSVAAEVKAGTTNVLDLTYPLDPTKITFDGAGVRLGLFTTDLKARGYLERYAPANLLFDRFPLTITAKVVGATAPHVLHANGTIERLNAATWRVTYPWYFTSSSFFFHLTDLRLKEREGTYQGRGAVIPFVVYSEDAALAERALPVMYDTLAELEGDYGTFAHEKIVAYVTPGGGGMEYDGATMTSLDALEHELFHSWFARGVRPADGNAGWIDEAMASWRDYGYVRPAALVARPPAQHAGWPPYRRETPGSSYTAGRDLLSDVDFLTAPAGGLKALMRKLFMLRPHGLVTTEELRAYLEGAGGVDLTALWRRYVYGLDVTPVEAGPVADEPSRHPRAYTDEELAAYR